MNPSSSSKDSGGDKEPSLGGGGDSVNSSDDGDNSRKRKAPPPSSEGPTPEEEAAATATLMSMPRNLYHKKDTSDSSSRDAKSDPDVDLSTIEGQQALNPDMSIEEARFQVRIFL